MKIKQAGVNSRRNGKVAANSKLNVLERKTKVGQKSGGRGTPGNAWWGSAAQFCKSWPYFRPKIVIFLTRFQTWPLKFIPVFRRVGGHKTQHHTRFTYTNLHINNFFLIHFELKRRTHWYTTVVLRKPYPIPDQNGQNLEPFSDQNRVKVKPFGAAHTYMAGIREYCTVPPPPLGTEILTWLTDQWRIPKWVERVP